MNYFKMMPGESCIYDTREIMEGRYRGNHIRRIQVEPLRENAVVIM